ncbi:unnamed protein product [Trichobilharzia szidati]|nr:unnamed protein product [Trichobilharzia szidati]CAH8823405.1 unnamed protein product [Trichobilharzia szidati]
MKRNTVDEQKSQVEESKVNRDAVLATRSLMQQLIRYNSNTNCPIYRKRQFNRDANSSSTITRSKTFTSGLNPLPRVKCSNGGHSVINPILRKSFEQKNEDDSIRSPVNNDKKDDTGSKQVTSHKTVKFGPIEECHYQGNKKITTKILTSENYSETTTTPSITDNTSTNLDISENSNSTHNSPVNPEVIVKSNEDPDENKEILLTKSTSFPNQLVQHAFTDQNRSSSSSALGDQCSDDQYCCHYYYYCNDHHQNYDQFPPLSATVLLAIPEIGENDYYADSPQCLTVKELKELGVYTSEEDDDDEEGDEDGVDGVDGDNNNDDDDEDVGGKSKEVLQSIREQREYRLDSNERISSSSPTYIHGTDIVVVSHTPSTTSEFNEIHASHHHHHHHEEVMI